MAQDPACKVVLARVAEHARVGIGQAVDLRGQPGQGASVGGDLTAEVEQVPRYFQVPGQVPLHLRQFLRYASEVQLHELVVVKAGLLRSGRGCFLG